MLSWTVLEFREQNWESWNPVVRGKRLWKSPGNQDHGRAILWAAFNGELIYRLQLYPCQSIVVAMTVFQLVIYVCCLNHCT